MSVVCAPFAPGKLGEPIDPQAGLRYLSLLQEWLNSRKRELDEIDQTIQTLDQNTQFTNDLMLSLALWQSVKNRNELLLETWDSGRVGLREREKISGLIWGRLETAGSGSASLSTSGMNVNLVEACRLSDALVASLRGKLHIDPAADETTARMAALKAQLERLRDQVSLEPAGNDANQAQQKLLKFNQRVTDVAAKLSRGGDIGGLINSLETELSTFERDLIVGGVLRRKLHDKRVATQQQADRLKSKQTALSQLVRTCMTTVSPAPNYAVPNVAALGDIPSTDAALDGYRAKLDQVSKAMGILEAAYQAALTSYENLKAQLATAKIKSDRLDSDPDLVSLYTLATSAMSKRPAQLPTCQGLVHAYVTAVNEAVTAKELQQ